MIKVYLQCTVLVCTAAVSSDLPYSWPTPLEMRKYIPVSNVHVSNIQASLPLFRGLSTALGLSSSDLQHVYVYANVRHVNVPTSVHTYNMCMQTLASSPSPFPFPAFQCCTCYGKTGNSTEEKVCNVTVKSKVVLNNHWAPRTCTNVYIHCIYYGLFTHSGIINTPQLHTACSTCT